MSNCNATLTAYDDDEACDLTCADHDDRCELPHGNWMARWADTTPGAKPHTPPRYRAVETPSGWLVTDDNGPVAMWYLHHPDPEPLALAEAARLNGEDDGYTLTQARSDRDAAVARAARYRAALEKIRYYEGRTCRRYIHGGRCDDDGCASSIRSFDIAREALEGT